MIHFCVQCGQAVDYRIPEGDERPRAVCTACGFIQYENPKLVVGCVAEWEGRVLLCRRAIEPRAGLWTLPAGFMENGESTAAAAVRETLEEAGAQTELFDLFALIDIPEISQVHLFYRGRLVDGRHTPGCESLETALFSEAEIPWEALAFHSVHLCLDDYFAARRKQDFSLCRAVLHHVHTAPCAK
jgi:ADP-ribose pyrophosphatase YjhB (NUDIX family)